MRGLVQSRCAGKTNAWPVSDQETGKVERLPELRRANRGMHKLGQLRSDGSLQMLPSYRLKVRPRKGKKRAYDARGRFGPWSSENWPARTQCLPWLPLERTPFSPAMHFSAQATTFGTLKPNLSMHVPPGADAPKTSMPTKASAHSPQPMVTAASTLIFGTPAGRIASLYSADCSRKSSQHGMDTTLTFLPLISLAASTQTPTSEPTPMRMMSGSSQSITA